MSEYVIESELKACKEGHYTIYVFQNLINEEYIMCTKMPNWQSSNIDIGEIGFLRYKIVKAGDIYYEPNSESQKTYRYSNIYFIDFIKKTNIINKEIIL